MTRNLMLTGLLATVLLVVTLGMAAVREPALQASAANRLRTEAVMDGIDRYAENCALCHGASGEGLGAVPALAVDALRAMEYLDLYRTVERGRYGTVMAAYGSAEGGIFTGNQIDSLVAVIQYASWDAVAARVSDLGITPVMAVSVVVPDDVLAVVRGLPDGDGLAEGLLAFADNCVACHGGNGEGSVLAPELNTFELRERLTDEDMQRIVAQGVPGTLMASWQRALDSTTIDQLVGLVRRWNELDEAGVVLPVVVLEPVVLSPEAISTGEWLFGILCTQCHGADGFGSPMAPALNNKLFLNATPDAAIQQIIRLGVTGTSMPAWGGRLLEDDILSLTAYLRSLEATAPSIVRAVAAPVNAADGISAGPPWNQAP